MDKQITKGNLVSDNIETIIYKKFNLNKSKVEKDLSKYARFGSSDFMAEGMSEYLDSLASRYIANAIYDEVQLLVNLLRAKRR